MKRRRNRRFRFDIKKLFAKQLLPIYAGVIIVVVVLVMVLSAGKSSGVTAAEDTELAGKQTLYIGVADELNPLIELTQTGATGFEAELIAELISRAYPDKAVEFKSIDPQLASYKLKQGEIHLAIGRFTKNVTKTKGLTLTKAYFTDDVCAYVAADSEIADYNELRSRDVLVMTTELEYSGVKEALDEVSNGMKVTKCSSYADAVWGVKEGRHDALISARQMMAERMEGLKELPTSVCETTYHILAWTDKTATVSYLNYHLEQMKQDGTVAALEQKYGVYKEEA